MRGPLSPPSASITKAPDARALGEGVVGIERCVAALKEIGYTGGISIEHEPEDHNPIEDIKLGLARLQGWLGN